MGRVCVQHKEGLEGEDGGMRWWTVVDDIIGKDGMDYVLNTTKCEDRSGEVGGSHIDYLIFGSDVRTEVNPLGQTESIDASYANSIHCFQRPPAYAATS